MSDHCAIIGTMNNKRTAEHQRRVLELRRSNATTPIQSKKVYSRKRKHKTLDFSS